MRDLGGQIAAMDTDSAMIVSTKDGGAPHGNRGFEPSAKDLPYSQCASKPSGNSLLSA